LVALFALFPASWLPANNAGPQPPAVGEKAANFELPVVGADDYIELKQQYASQPVVVVVLRGYPGYQCPLCNRQVGALINRAKALAKAAGKVILVYPGEPTELERHAEQFLGSRTVPEPLVLVRDPDMKMVTQWGLRWNAPRETAYPATFVINKSGRVAWSKISKSHAGRSTVAEILRELRKIQ
jgi:peroxiredoxin